jgi:hypothetical protein
MHQSDHGRILDLTLEAMKLEKQFAERNWAKASSSYSNVDS